MDREKSPKSDSINVTFDLFNLPMNKYGFLKAFPVHSGYFPIEGGSESLQMSFN